MNVYTYTIITQTVQNCTIYVSHFLSFMRDCLRNGHWRLSPHLCSDGGQRRRISSRHFHFYRGTVELLCPLKPPGVCPPSTSAERLLSFFRNTEAFRRHCVPAPYLGPMMDGGHGCHPWLTLFFLWLPLMNLSIESLCSLHWHAELTMLKQTRALYLIFQYLSSSIAPYFFPLTSQKPHFFKGLILVSYSPFLLSLFWNNY